MAEMPRELKTKSNNFLSNKTNISIAEQSVDLNTPHLLWSNAWELRPVNPMEPRFHVPINLTSRQVLGQNVRRIDCARDVEEPNN